MPLAGEFRKVPAGPSGGVPQEDEKNHAREVRPEKEDEKVISEDNAISKTANAIRSVFHLLGYWQDACLPHKSYPP